VNVSAVCRFVAITRQNYYARRRRRQRREVDGQLVCQLVQQERHLQPRLGARKLRVLLQGPFQEAGVRLGRDRFFEVLRQGGLLLQPKRSEHPQTTHSSHSLPVFRNLIRELEVRRPNEVWVGDLTYLRSQEGFMFLALLTDKMSRHIVGYDCADSLESIGCQRALKMAMRQLRPGEQPIHHSDRGSQYCCHDYVTLASAGGLSLSMTETDHCAENALAERMNGILKSEYGLDQEFKTKAQIGQAVDQAIALYGTRRPHSALGNQFPAVVHKSFLPPPPPTRGLPGHWAPGARPERRTGVRRPAQVGAIPVADQPVEPLRGK
jgi:transposase InsO family protein